MKLNPPKWNAIQPRLWQREALDKILAHFNGPERLKRIVVRAVMGSGKSILLSELCSCAELAKDEVIVITTSSIMLVEQLEGTLNEMLFTEAPKPGTASRLEGFATAKDLFQTDSVGKELVGTYYTHSKDIHTPIIVTCAPSAPELAQVLKGHNKKCVLWIGDEAHRSTCDTMIAAYDTLKPELSCGFTATPWRAKTNEGLVLFDEVIFDYTPKRALDEGVVVPWRIVPWKGGEMPLDEACHDMTKDAVGPGLFNAKTIQDAERFSQKLTAMGLSCQPIHSGLNKVKIKNRIADLKHGRVRALCHVAMLQEGADFPWLQWLCMRRPVSSRVRFAQEVGRVLRASPGKSEAVLYDPHDLFGDMRLSYEAVLGGDVVEEEKDAKELLEDLCETMMKELLEAKAGKKPFSLSPLAAYLRELIVAFDICGLIDRKVTSRHWRHQQSSDKQRSALLNMRWILKRRYVPKNHATALTMLCETAEQLNKGLASDMLSCMFSLADKRKWPDMKAVDDSLRDNVVIADAAPEPVEVTHEDEPL